MVASSPCATRRPLRPAARREACRGVLVHPAAATAARLVPLPRPHNHLACTCQSVTNLVGYLHVCRCPCTSCPLWATRPPAVARAPAAHRGPPACQSASLPMLQLGRSFSLPTPQSLGSFPIPLRARSPSAPPVFTTTAARWKYLATFLCGSLWLRPGCSPPPAAAAGGSSLRVCPPPGLVPPAAGLPTSPLWAQSAGPVPTRACVGEIPP